MNVCEGYNSGMVYDSATDNIEELLTGFTCYTSFLEEAKTWENAHLPECNTALILYDYKYTGGIREAEQEGVHLYFLGYTEYAVIFRFSQCSISVAVSSGVLLSTFSSS